MLGLELDGMKSPGDDSASPAEVEPKDDEATENDGEMALEAITQNDGMAFEEAVNRIIAKHGKKG